MSSTQEIQGDNGTEEILNPHTRKDSFLVPAWQCSKCGKNCIPVRSESRCICGHRLKQHGQDKIGNDPFRCQMTGCACPSFFYIVAEGSWILKCGCKHKHTDHDPVTHACKRPQCQCQRFQSPWVCNCNHKWSDHSQILERKLVSSKLKNLAREANINLALMAADTACTDESMLHIVNGSRENLNEGSQITPPPEGTQGN